MKREHRNETKLFHDYDVPEGYRSFHSNIAHEAPPFLLPLEVVDVLVEEKKKTADDLVAARAAAFKDKHEAEKAKREAATPLSVAAQTLNEQRLAQASKEDAPELTAWGEKPDPSMVAVFPYDVLRHKALLIEASGTDTDVRRFPWVEAGCRYAGRRRIVTRAHSAIAAGLKQLKADMPNFAEAVDLLLGELALAQGGKPEDFFVSPLLLNGVPGIGKTYFAGELARILCVELESVALGSSSAGFSLSGVAAGYGSSRPGRIWTVLAEGEHASPVVLLDEIDKAAGDLQHPIAPTLLELLEPRTAMRFRDQCMEVDIDASKVIYIATSNEVSGIDRALISRLRVVDIRPPTKSERRGIVTHMAGHFESVFVKFDATVLDDLADTEADLRGYRRILREAVGRALVDGRRVVVRGDVSLPKATRATVGFV